VALLSCAAAWSNGGNAGLSLHSRGRLLLQSDYIPSMKRKVLFICIHNSARSQMAEAFLNRLCGEQFEAQSAGLEPGKLNPIVVEAMKEIGIDISGNRTKSVSDILKSRRSFAYVVTVCDESSAERCPIFPGSTTRLHWGFPDPSAVAGTHDEKLARTRQIRDAIKVKVEAFCGEVCRTVGV
jgi:arsenate reductase